MGTEVAFDAERLAALRGSFSGEQIGRAHV